MSAVDIRPALQTDLADVQACARKAYAKYLERMNRKPAAMHADFASQIAKGFVVVATYESRFAGYVVFYSDYDHVHLENLAVVPEYSGGGLGKRLIQHVESMAKESGYRAVELYTNEAMSEDLAMYPKLGYTEVCRRREAGFSRVFFRKQI